MKLELSLLALHYHYWFLTQFFCSGTGTAGKLVVKEGSKQTLQMFKVSSCHARMQQKDGVIISVGRLSKQVQQRRGI